MQKVAVETVDIHTYTCVFIYLCDFIISYTYGDWCHVVLLNAFLIVTRCLNVFLSSVNFIYG